MYRVEGEAVVAVASLRRIAVATRTDTYASPSMLTLASIDSGRDAKRGGRLEEARGEGWLRLGGPRGWASSPRCVEALRFW